MASRDTAAVSLTSLPEFRGLRPLNAPAKRAYPRSAWVDDMRHSAAYRPLWGRHHSAQIDARKISAQRVSSWFDRLQGWSAQHRGRLGTGRRILARIEDRGIARTAGASSSCGTRVVSFVVSDREEWPHRHRVSVVSTAGVTGSVSTLRTVSAARGG
jgi:hypothetical protein